MKLGLVFSLLKSVEKIVKIVMVKMKRKEVRNETIIYTGKKIK